MKIATVLVVDDININRVMIKSLLNDICYIVQASGGNEALNLLLKMEQPPDMILLDLIMSGMSGLEFMELLRGLHGLSGIPIMVVTSMTDKSYQQRAMGLGAVDFIKRPYNPETFKARVISNLEYSKANQNKKSTGDDIHQFPVQSKPIKRNNGSEDEILLDILAGLSRNVKATDVLAGACQQIIIQRERAQILVLNMLKHNKYRQTLINNNYESVIKAMPINDIGKIGIPESILLKKGTLTAEEFDIVKKHPKVGADIIMRMMEKNGENDYLKNCYNICLCHHERWDGRGYPEQLSAEQIPLSARISALLDVYDALTRDKPYKKANTHSEAIEIMSAGRASQFDPYLIDGFLEVQKLIYEIGYVQE